MRPLPALARSAFSVAATLVRVSTLLAANCAVAATQGPLADPATWPTLHRDNVRSGFFPGTIEGPFERKWFRDFHDEMIATRVEAIVADGRVFVGTYAGNVHALQLDDGRTAWVAELGAPIGHSPLWMDGRLYVGCQDGRLVCLDARDGAIVWIYEAGAGIWVHPASDGERVVFGDRSGVFHAVDLEGRRAWTHATGHIILTPASIGPEGRIVFGAEDMRLRCMSPDGELLWRSDVLAGLSLRDHAPTIWRGLALVRSNPAAHFHGALGMRGKAFAEFHASLPESEEDKVLFDAWGAFAMQPTERRQAAESAWIRRRLREAPHEKTFHAMRLEDGREPWTAPVLYCGGLHNPPTPPTFDPRTGMLYAWGTTGLSNFTHGVPGGFVHVLVLNRANGDTRHLALPGDVGLTGTAFAQPADEAFALSLMGDVLLNTHMGSVLGLRLDDFTFVPVSQGRDTYGGVFGRPTALEVDDAPKDSGGGFYGPMRRAHRRGFLVHMANEWHGPDRAAVSVAAERLLWVVGSQVVCLGGPSSARATTGGRGLPEPKRRTRAPVVPGGNVAVGSSRLDPETAVLGIGAEQLRRYLLPPGSVTGAEALPAPPEIRALREDLEAQVNELLQGDWSPWVLQLGLAGVEVRFARSAETMRALSLALPHLSVDTRERAVAALDRMWSTGVPLGRRAAEGQLRREPHRCGPRLLADAPAEAAKRLEASSPLEDLYAVWAYAHHADRWDAVAAEADAIRAHHERDRAGQTAFDHADQGHTNAAEHLNRRIAGALAFARLMQRLGTATEVDAALATAARLLSERVHHERADLGLVRGTRFTSGLRSHAADVPRYVGMTPELARMLSDHARPALRRNLRALARELPVWYLAWGERLIGGENYINPPSLAYGLFTTFAWAEVASSQELHRWLDVPWVRADLHHIEKLVALLDRGH